MLFGGATPAPFLLLAPALVVAIALVSGGARWCLGALAILGVLGLPKLSVAMGPIDLRATDAGYILVALGVLVEQRRRGSEPATDMGQFQLALFLGAMGVSLVPAIVTGIAGIGLIVSWLRLIATFTLLWLIPMGIREESERHFVLKAAAWALFVSLGWAVFEASSRGAFDDRLSGINGPNTTGLLAVIMLILVLHAEVFERRAVRNVALVVALAALIMSRSIGSIAATGLVFGIYGLGHGFDSDPRAAALRRPARALLLGLGVITLVGVLRPGNLPGDDGFDDSTTAHRLVLAQAGLSLMAENPVTGVGWQRSSLAEVIGEPELNEALRRRYPKFRDNFFPDENPSGVHNTFVQVLAEGGIVGGTTFVFLIVAVVRRQRRLIGRLGRRSPHDQVHAHAAVMILLAILVWWNDNALYGAQPESIMAAFALGILASCRLRPEPDADPAPHGSTSALEPLSS